MHPSRNFESRMKSKTLTTRVMAVETSSTRLTNVVTSKLVDFLLLPETLVTDR
jgi:hypothetical protein